MSLELRSVLLCQLFGVLLTLFSRLINIIAILILLLLLGLGLLGSDEENFEGSGVANWIAIKNVTSVLAIVLTQTPAEGLTHDVRWDLLLAWVGLEVVSNLLLQIKRLELIIRLSLIGSKLFELSFIVGLTIIDGTAFSFSAFSAFTFNCTFGL